MHRHACQWERLLFAFRLGALGGKALDRGRLCRRRNFLASSSTSSSLTVNGAAGSPKHSD